LTEGYTMIDLRQLRFIGEGLSRPECVLATRSGDLFVSDTRGGVSMIRPDGAVEFTRARGGPADLFPNGIALLTDRSYLIANLGPSGGVFRLRRNGTILPVLTELEGKPLPPTNFVAIDRVGRTWVTVSTRVVPREQAARKGHADGFVVVIDDRGARIVAEGIGYTNEALVDPSGRWLYVNETIARLTTRYAIGPDGSLSGREIFAEYGAATFPDGLAFDAEGGVWIVSIASNRVIRITPDGRQHLMLEDQDPGVLASVEEAYQADRFGRAEMDAGRTRSMANVSSLAFGGPDLRTLYFGSLFGNRVSYVRQKIAGAPPVHWDF
jgi:sugar lactone lactonase YvrE